MRYKVHAEYFGYDQEKRKEKLRTAAETVKKITQHADRTLRAMDEYLPAVMEEWLTIKSEYLIALDRFEKEKQLMKAEHEKVLSDMHREMGQVMHELSQAKTEINSLEIHILQQTATLNELRPMKALLSEARESLHKTSLARLETVKELESLRTIHVKLQEEATIKERTLTEALQFNKDKLKETHVNLMSALDKTVDLQVSSNILY